ncbi:helix-turn-helix domain-containing protein [Pseudomonas sp. R5(2019)]|uniref:helix-turn-helix domain-containing protein n=1 Tax=Pseudomonas sp. R5(2019) TaxID=2697566 RepID=UPI0014123797|nr:helix-turn-helix domain-containing protein [Pseudomonas sp. R5(2019)]NBA94790.1 helix-turn-helix domain-containing protein [Pseudomonas sp. R5(2019)]
MNSYNPDTRPGSHRLADSVGSAEFFHSDTHDVFEQAEALPKWQQDYLQISAGAFTGSLTALSLGPVQIFRESMNKVVDQHGQPWENSFAVGVPLSIEGEGFWCGDRLEKNSIFFLKPNSELKFKTPEHSDICVAVIDSRILKEYAETIEELSIDHIIDLNGATPLSEALCNRFRHTFLHVITALKANPDVLSSHRIRLSLLDDVMSSFFNGFTQLEKLPRKHPGQFVHRHIVEKAREYIISRKSEPLSVIEICEALRVSRRTLHYGFIKVLGINPVTFLRYLRLNGARRELMKADPSSKVVNEIASRWGFWHPGMFSTYYKELFGELPSHTLRLKK